ncbi:MAG: glycosyltransferase family 4 protein [Micropepsaceae bacterium]
MPRAARVLHVFKYFRPQFTGEGTFLERIAPTFHKLRPHVEHDVLCTLTGRPAGGHEPIEGISSVSHLRPRGNKSNLTFLELFWWTLCNIWRYDTVHYHTHVDRTFASYWLAALLRRRLVLSATLDDSTVGIAGAYRPQFRRTIRSLLRCFDAFVSISPKLHDETVADIGAERAHLIPMGIQMPAVTDNRRRQARKDLGISEETLVLVSVGGISRRKDQMTLIRSMPQLMAKFPGLLLILVGPVMEPEYARSISEFVNENALQNNVRLAGWIQAPWPYYEAADLMVFASREEGFGTVMIEAMSYAVPVVARRLKGINDVFIRQGETGFLFECDAEFETLVAALLSDGGQRHRIGRAAREFVLPRYGMDRAAERYLAVYGFAPTVSNSI